MSRDLSFVLVLALALWAAAPAVALERASARVDDDERSWGAGGTLTLTYYNICTGWGWIWSGWQPGERFGARFELPYYFCTPTASYVLFATGAPAGYGFTGTVSFQGIDANGCPDGTMYATQQFLPETGWNYTPWGFVATPEEFALVHAFGEGQGNPAAVYTDHPAAGPTGPVACGTCYPTTRVTRSFQWGPEGSPLCPGLRFSDGTCDAELLLALDAMCTDYIVPESWAAVKQLYR